MMEQIIDPPNLSFWTLAVIYFQMFLQIFKKNSVGCKWNWKVLKANKTSENYKKNSLNHFSIWWSKKLTHQPRFLNSRCNVLSNYTCNFSINQLDSNETGKCWKQTKVVRIPKIFYFLTFFSIWMSKFSTSQPKFLNSFCNLLSN